MSEAERIGRLRREAGVAGEGEGGTEGEAAAGGDAAPRGVTLQGDKVGADASTDGAPAAEPPAPAPAAAPASPAPAAPGASVTTPAAPVPHDACGVYAASNSYTVFV